MLRLYLKGNRRSWNDFKQYIHLALCSGEIVSHVEGKFLGRLLQQVVRHDCLRGGPEHGKESSWERVWNPPVFMINMLGKGKSLWWCPGFFCISGERGSKNLAIKDWREEWQRYRSRRRVIIYNERIEQISVLVNKTNSQRKLCLWGKGDNW